MTVNWSRWPAPLYMMPAVVSFGARSSLRSRAQFRPSRGYAALTPNSRLPPANSEIGAARSPLKRLLPLAIILVMTGVVIGSGLHRFMTFETLVRHRDSLHAFIAVHRQIAIATYTAIYAVAVALSLPGALILTLAGGILFGGIVGGIATIVGATIGASVVFLAAKSAFGEYLVRRAGPAVGRIAAGFQADAFNYLLFLRLVPLFPFWLVNLVPAFVGISLGTFVAATAIGIVPATFAFAFLGASLDSVVRAQGAAYDACLSAGRTDCRVEFDLKAIVTPELIAALVVLGVFALVPVVVRRLRGRARIANSRH